MFNNKDIKLLRRLPLDPSIHLPEKSDRNGKRPDIYKVPE